MSEKNEVKLQGHLGAEPKAFKEGDKYFVSISLATNEYYKNAKGESCVDKQWHTVYFNNNVAKSALEELHKGDEIRVVGKLKYSTYQDETGKNRVKAGVQAKHYECIKSAANRKQGAMRIATKSPQSVLSLVRDYPQKMNKPHSQTNGYAQQYS